MMVDVNADLVDNLFADMGIEDTYIRYQYSGRGMYGRTCLGVVCSSPAALMLDLGLLLAEWQPEDLADIEWEYLLRGFRSPSTDNMGLDMIIYWPQIHVVMEDEI